jgi:predicted O-methyltransferase YrrM
MEHFYKNIQGWCNYEEIYKKVVNIFGDNSKFVEIGCWRGQSAAYMAVEIINSNKNIEFYCVDTWKGSEELKHHKSVTQDTLYNEFLNNTKTVSSVIKPIRLSSLEAANKFEDNFFDFIFIDASHDYENVKKDILAWYPKLKSTGIIAGHDYYPGFPGVVLAVNEVFDLKRLKVTAWHQSWVVYPSQN